MWTKRLGSLVVVSALLIAVVSTTSQTAARGATVVVKAVQLSKVVAKSSQAVPTGSSAGHEGLYTGLQVSGPDDGADFSNRWVPPAGTTRLGKVSARQSLSDALPVSTHARVKGATRSPHVSFTTYSTATSSSHPYAPEDTSTAAGGSAVMYVRNDELAVSTNGGATFFPGVAVQNIFPPFNGAPSICCDMIVRYAPSMDAFLWVIQFNGSAAAGGSNFERVVVVPRASVVGTVVDPKGITAYWWYDFAGKSIPGENVTVLPANGGNSFFDYPQLTIGTNDAYLGYSTGSPGSGNVTNSDMVRLPLSPMAAAAGFSFNYLVAPFNQRGMVAERTGTTAFWAWVINNASLGIASWPEGSNVVTSYTQSIQSFPSSGIGSYIGSTLPNGQQWLKRVINGVTFATFYTNYVYGAARDSNTLYFAFEGAAGNGIPYAHVEIVALTGANSSLSFLSQRALWYSGAAAAWPALTQVNHHIGLAVVVGGATSYPHTSFTDLTTSPNVTYAFPGAVAGCGCQRWGDYQSIAPAYAGKSALTGGDQPTAFVVSGYLYENVDRPVVVDRFARFTP